jgi:hypothetical protein
MGSSPANIRAYDERMSARPHHVGSPFDRDNAEWMLTRFKEWGWDAKIMQSERQLLDPAGLPHREWYRHLLYAPGFYTGYGVKTLPGVRESIEQRQYTEADAEIARAAKVLEREAALVDAAAAELERLAPAAR